LFQNLLIVLSTNGLQQDPAPFAADSGRTAAPVLFICCWFSKTIHVRFQKRGSKIALEGYSWVWISLLEVDYGLLERADDDFSTLIAG